MAHYGWTTNFDAAEADNTDHDPYTAGEEYILDYNPTVSNDWFRIRAISNSPPVTIYFESSSNRMYTMAGCSNLVNGAWTNIPGSGPDRAQTVLTL